MTAPNTNTNKGYQPATGKVHDNFLAWSRSQGITFNKITPVRFDNAGLGIASTAPIEGPRRARQGENRNRLGFTEGETIAFTPKAALLTRENVGVFAPGLKGRVGPLLKELGTHGCFALAIATEVGNEENAWRPWIKVWPTIEEFKEGLPLLWKREEQELLPPSAISLLNDQKAKFETHFEKIQKLGFEFTRDEYIYAWLIVNTRSLFYKLETPEYKELEREDCMALCPFIDYFNHSDNGVSIAPHPDSGGSLVPRQADLKVWARDEPNPSPPPPDPNKRKQCKVELTSRGYTVTPVESLGADEQLFVTYGCHSNDFLLCEYGFVLPTPANKWDEVRIDSLVLPALTASQKNMLRDEGFLGNYTFDRAQFCFRTQAAVRMMLIRDPENPRNRAKVEKWRRFLGGEEDGRIEKVAVEEWLAGLLGKLKERGRGAWGAAEELETESVKRLVQERWEQILGMVEAVGEVLEVEVGGEGRDLGAYIM